jgi:hypothetical protein
MGQQQLLLIVLGIIIVGVAVVVGINLFTVHERQARFDSIISEFQSIAGMSLAYYQKPKSMGGGGHSFEGFRPAISSIDYDSTKANGSLSVDHWWFTDLGRFAYREHVGGTTPYSIIELYCNSSQYEKPWFLIRMIIGYSITGPNKQAPNIVCLITAEI